MLVETVYKLCYSESEVREIMTQVSRSERETDVSCKAIIFDEEFS